MIRHLSRFAASLIVFGAVLACTDSLRAEVIAYDPFLIGVVGTDPATDHVSADPTNGIYGAPNGNFNHSNIGFNNIAVEGGPIIGFGNFEWDTNTAFIRSNSANGLTNPGLNQEDFSPLDNGGLRHSGDSRRFFIRDLKRILDPYAASDTYYMSGLFRVPVTDLNEGSVLFGWIGDELSGNGRDTNSLEFQGIFYGIEGNGSGFDLITRNRDSAGGSPVDTVLATGVTEGETQLLVLKVEVNVDGALDQITAWVNPDQSQLDPGGAASSYSADIFDSADALTQLWFATETPLPGTTEFDEPRLATTYAEAVGLAPFVLTGNEWLGPAGGNWNVAGNWSDNVVPNGAADEAVLGGNIASSSTVSLDTNITASKISIDSTHSYTIDGANTLTLAGDAELAVLSGAHSVSATVAGSSGLNKTAGGTLTLGGANTFTGGISLAAGRTNYQENSNLGNAAGGIGLDGGSLRYTGAAATISRSLSMSASSTLDASGSGVLTYDAATISQTGSGTRTLILAGSNTGDNTLQSSVGDNGGDATNVTKTGTGTWVLAGNNSYSGPTLILGGTVKIASGNALGNATGGTIIAADGRLEVSAGISSADEISFGGKDSADSAQLFNTSGNNTLSGELGLNSGGDFHVIQSDAGKLTLSGNLTNNTAGGGGFTAGDPSATTLVLAGAGDGELSGTFTENQNPMGEFLSVTSLLKTGGGTWTISTGTNLTQEFYQGITTIAEGTLVVVDRLNPDEGELSSNNVIVESGANFDVSAFDNYSLQVGQSLSGSGTVSSTNLRAFDDTNINPGNDSGGAIGTLSIAGDLSIENIFAAPTGALNYDLGEQTTDADLIDITGDLSLTTTMGDVVIKVNPTGNSLATGSYRIIDYAGSLTGSAADFTVDAPTRHTFTVDTLTGGQINLNVSGSPGNVTWSGSSGTDWDINNTQAWDNGGPDVYFDFDSVTFDDTATTFAANLTETVRPVNVTFNNSTNDYTISGSGKISGTTGVVKNGTGSAAISTANSYTGATQINAGTLVAGNNTALGSTDAGTTVANGAALDISGVNIGAEAVTAEGSGVGGLGAITSSGSDDGDLSSLTLTGNTTVGAHGDEARWDLATTLVGNGHTLTKVGTGTVNFNNVHDGTLVGDFNGNLVVDGSDFLGWQLGESPVPLSPTDLADWEANYSEVANTGLADIVVNAGRLGFLNGTGLGNTANTATVNAGGTLAVSGASRAVDKPIVLNGGTLSNNGSGSAQSFSNVSLTADSTIDAGGGSVTISNALSGAVGLTKTGTGTLVLPAVNTYTGSTVVQAGTVSLGAGGSVASSPTIDVQVGATLDVSGLGGLSTASGQTVMGGGTVQGNLTMTSGSTIAPNPTGGQLVQTLGAAQDVLIRWRPTDPPADNPEKPTGSGLFVGPISLNDQTRSFMDFDVSGLVGELSSVSLEVFRGGSDGGSADADVQLQLHRVTKPWVAGQVTATEYDRENTLLWDNIAGDFDAAVLSSVTRNASEFGKDTSDSLLWDNTANFLAALNIAKSDDGTLRLILKLEDADEVDGGRHLFRIRSSDHSASPVLAVAANVDGSTLTVDGDLTMQASSTLAIDIGGELAGVDYDVLNATGNAAIDGGTLDVSLVGGFAPGLGDAFDILNFATSSGTGFDTFNLPTLGGLDWDTSNLLTTGILSVIAGGGGSAVPEPSSCLLLLIGILAAGVTHRSRR